MPFIKVLRGRPTPEEVAIVTAVLSVWAGTDRTVPDDDPDTAGHTPSAWASSPRLQTSHPLAWRVSAWLR